MIAVDCWICGTELAKPGAIILSPPDHSSRCDKMHVCVVCWGDFEDFLEALEELHSNQIERT